MKAIPLYLLAIIPALEMESAPHPDARVEAEEEVYRFVSPDNGTNPMWCYGNTCIVRDGEKLFASGYETLESVKPYNNTRWLLFQRDSGGWKLVRKDEKERTREPSPLVVASDGHLYLSVNPTLAAPDDLNGPAEPRVLEFSTASPESPYRTLMPKWELDHFFSQHSYRSFVTDRESGEMILFNIEDDYYYPWSFRDADGNWSSKGVLAFPWGADYAKPQVIRICYPAVHLKDRAVHFFGVSDIKEPNPQWREYKRQLTGREWDYDFRRVFYTWSDDITEQSFHPWVEVAGREETGGWLRPTDIWVGPDGLAHILWLERAIDERLRKKFFPDARQTHALNYAVIDRGKVVYQVPIVQVEEGEPGPVPVCARFQVTPDNRLFVFYAVADRDAAFAAPAKANLLLEIMPDRSFTKPVKVPLEIPLSGYFTATVRGGSGPSHTLDVLGMAGHTMRYARIEIGD